MEKEQIINILAMLIFILLYYCITKVIKCNVSKFLKNKNKSFVINFLIQLISVFIYTISVCIILSNFDIFKSLTKILLTGSGLFVVVLAFISQEAISNTINGILLIFSNAFEINDIVTIPEQNITGKIQAITLHHTEILNFENNTIIVPNKIMNNILIENRRANKYICNFLYVNIDYSTNINKVEKIIKEIIRNHKYYEDIRTEEDKQNNKEDIGFIVYDFGESYIKLRVSIWTLAENGFYLLSDVRRQILETFEQNNIEIPLNKIDVNLRNSKKIK